MGGFMLLFCFLLSEVYNFPSMTLQHIKQNLAQNWKSALSVALVSVPLSLSLGIASGAGPVAGIVAAVWAGLVAGIVGGSQFNIVGPAGALSGILASYAVLYGPGILPLIAIVAGVLIVLVWLLRWDKYIIFIPSSVVHGFTFGVALTIGFGQLNFALGLSGLPTHEHLWQNVLESFKHIGSLQMASSVVFLLASAAMFGLLKYAPKLPNTVIVAVLGIIGGFLTTRGIIPVSLPTLFTKYGDLSLSLFSMPHISVSAINPGLISAGAVVAFVVILETLLSAKIADGMTKTKANQHKEVLGVGLANLASGIFGGVPASGVFARTSINVRSGATSQWSQTINAGFVAIIALVFLPYFKYIPLSVIAAILVYAAIRMVTTEHFRRLYRHDPTAFYNAMTIAVVTIVYDATAGILVGTLVALVVFAKRLSKAHCQITTMPGDIVEEEDKGATHIYHVAGELTYLNAKSHTERLMAIAPATLLVLDFSHAFYIDTDGMEALDEIIEHFEQHGQKVAITGVQEKLLPFFIQHEWYKRLLQS